ncbi:hypothetical protein G7076_01405 [Sphingomonas sp. HDW15A]|uniref:hypothetical protein n=1 Tax=Sphingomonas sp. HDW15A TaxID=2714942 RepID=UPI00140BBA85|nr:hypothetical protein [Sphingomonas sp. HDW15A]QIK95318.1 hypothetical protein G7076_01405 [Sphingomonas sp. HDW15A]
MTELDESPPSATLNPLFSILVGGLFPLTAGTMLGDWAYSTTYQIQWLNFADWLIAGSLVFAVPALLWALLGLLLRRGPGKLFVLLLAATVVVNFLNALTHARDAYATMPAGLILSVIGSILALASSWLGFSGRRSWGRG